MKIIHSAIVGFASSIVLSSCSTDPSGLAPLSTVNTVATEGTLANPTLARDASQAIRELNSNRSAKVLKFVLQQPVGSPGRKAWREMWIYDPDHAKRSYILTFREDGEGSADFEIQPFDG
ncbi:MAG: hypothetical protein MUF31_10970 [Akkermansiaceae bacterium]|jgi:hypothetical protein|nr:hypothetical protein [Akkermansiaceae bacterium]